MLRPITASTHGFSNLGSFCESPVSDELSFLLLSFAARPMPDAVARSVGFKSSIEPGCPAYTFGYLFSSSRP
jgi:hypothetical protein